MVIGAAIEVHKSLGPGLLESAYESCLFYELSHNGLNVKRQQPLPLAYKQVKLDCGYRVDLLVKNCVVVELKAVEQVKPIHEAQLLSYLKLSGCSVGLLLNFNCTRMVDGITRRVFNHPS
ncbi:MAG: GxxExxY protein [Planctomycetota bacterium]